MSLDERTLNKIRLYNDKCKTNLFLFNAKTLVLIRVSKQQFQQAEGGVVKFQNFLIKVQEGTRNNVLAMRPYLSTIHEFKEEGLIEILSLSFKATSTFTKIAYKIMKQESNVETNALILDVLSLDRKSVV